MHRDIEKAVRGLIGRLTGCEQRPGELAEEVSEFLMDGKVRSLEQIGRAVGMGDLGKLQRFLGELEQLGTVEMVYKPASERVGELLEQLGLLERGYKLTHFGKRIAELPPPDG